MLLENNRSILTVVPDIVGDVQGLLRSEFRLSIAETQEQVAKAAKASRLPAAGIAALLFAVGFLLLAAVYALELVLAPWLAALIVGLVLLAIGGVTISYGMQRMKHVGKPEKTMDTAKENVEWANQQLT